MTHPSTTPTTLPSGERVQQELASTTSLDDFFGKEGIFARLFASTVEQMLEAELTAQLGDARYAAAGRPSGHSRTGKRPRQRRKVTKTKGAFPSAEAARKVLFLINRDITRKWTMPVHNWACILNQLAIRFEDRFPSE